MKPAAVYFSLVWLSACSFPSYEVHPPTCTDGRLNGDETGVDCGMAACGTGCDPGQGCKTDADCSSGLCADSICQPAGCDDGQRDGGETGVDCGMAACSKACPPGQGCGDDSDCDGGACAGDVCQAPSCDDQLTNGAETDRDCGGDEGCQRCTVGQHCSASSDCDGGECTSGQCRAPTCKDSLTNGSETDLNCGGNDCLPCGVGQACATNADCDDVACHKGKCQPAACDDGITNQDETDLDCGGSCPSGCDDGLHCKVAGDCASGVCTKATLTCAVPTCDDGVRNGKEPSKDCGGDCSKKCALLDACDTDADCTTSSCLSQRCVPTSATGQALSRLKWTATASITNTNSTAGEAIDGNSNSYWTTGKTQAPGMWFTLDMQSEQVFFSIEIDCFKQANDFAVGMDVELSDDGTFGGSPVEPNLSTTTGQTVITFSEPQLARYIRFSLTQGGDYWWSIDELRVKQ